MHLRLGNSAGPKDVSKNSQHFDGVKLIGQILAMSVLAIGASAQTVTLKNQTFYGTLKFYRPQNLTITNCNFAHGGVIVYGGGYTCGSTIDIERCHFYDCSPAIQLNGVVYDPYVTIRYNQIDGDDFTPRNDQISIYQSSGSEVRSIMIVNNYLRGNPNAPRVYLSGGIVLDAGSNYVLASDNVCEDIDMAMAGQSGVTEMFVGNTVVGNGIANGWTFGMGMYLNCGYCIGNTVGWVNTYNGTLNNYVVLGGPQTTIEGNGNSSLAMSDIPSAKATLYWKWANKIVANNAWPVGAQ